MVDQLVEALNSCDGIIVEHHEIRSEEEFSLHDLRETKKWDYDYMTSNERLGGDIAPEP